MQASDPARGKYGKYGQHDPVPRVCFLFLFLRRHYGIDASRHGHGHGHGHCDSDSREVCMYSIVVSSLDLISSYLISSRSPLISISSPLISSHLDFISSQSPLLSIPSRSPAMCSGHLRGGMSTHINGTGKDLVRVRMESNTIAWDQMRRMKRKRMKKKKKMFCFPILMMI